MTIQMDYADTWGAPTDVNDYSSVLLGDLMLSILVSKAERHQGSCWLIN